MPRSRSFLSILLLSNLVAVFGVLLPGTRGVLAFETVRCRLADGFDFPCGKPEGQGYYKARGFWPNGHLGEDWNGSGGGDSDSGDPIYAIGEGVVVLSEDVRVGWGNVVIIRHAYREPTGKIEMVDSLYGHLLERRVNVGQIVTKGQLVGLMGGNNGMYPVHLHLEVRKNLNIGMNRSKFARDYSNYHSPTPFINARRTLSPESRRYDIPVDTFAPYGGELTETQREKTPTSSTPSAVTPAGGAGRVSATNGKLSIPVVNGPGGYRPGAVAPAAPPSGSPSPTGGTTPGTVSPAPMRPTSQDGDFWGRLKNKLNSGQVTPGVENR